ncbi:MAG: hypothetical protein Q4B36_05070 [Tissierellia bacterium]|nr:hypothetical protein [Tissierellia bacterium]
MEKLIEEIIKDIPKLKYQTLIMLREAFKDLINRINDEIEKRCEDCL